MIERRFAMPSYVYECPVGRKTKKHSHRIEADRKQGNPKCTYCGKLLELTIIGLWRGSTPLPPQVIKLGAEVKEEKVAGKGGLENFVNPSENLKGDVERMAENVG
jgi:hypothetical protein